MADDELAGLAAPAVALEPTRITSILTSVVASRFATTSEATPGPSGVLEPGELSLLGEIDAVSRGEQS
jgi:hypothetical protein